MWRTGGPGRLAGGPLLRTRGLDRLAGWPVRWAGVVDV